MQTASPIPCTSGQAVPLRLQTLRSNCLYQHTCNRTHPTRPNLRGHEAAPQWQHARLHRAEATTSDIIVGVLNEESRRAKPASLLELLDSQGWGVTVDTSRRFSTQFASVSLEASWDDNPTGAGRTASRRLALLAVYQEWLVARSGLLGRAVEAVERLRPGFLGPELLDRLRAARAAGGLTPATEALDAQSLLPLAALLLPPPRLDALTAGVLAATRRELLASPAYRGRPDLLPSLERGMRLLAASVDRTAATARFRAANLREAIALQAELRRQQQAKRGRREQENTSFASMWLGDQSSPSASTSSSSSLAASLSRTDAAARSATDRLYGGQLAAAPYPWMDPAARAAAAAAPAGRVGPRGLPAGRPGAASFRPLPGGGLFSDPGRPGCGSFGGADRAAFAALDAAMRRLLALADAEVPAAALSVFARRHRTALMDALVGWQWGQLEGGGEAGRFYPPRSSHAVALSVREPLLVSRRTKIRIGPGPELGALRGLVRSRGAAALEAVHPLAAKQVSTRGEWDYWRDAYRLWGRFAPLPPRCSAATLTLVLTAEQVPYVCLLEADAAAAAGRRAAAAAATAAAAASAATSGGAADGDDMATLTSMSSIDLDDTPLPAGLAAAAAGGGGAAVTSPVQQTKTTLRIAAPPLELRRLMLALLELLPRHLGSAAAATAPSTSSLPGGSAAAAAAASEWQPAGARVLQVRYNPPPPTPRAAVPSAPSTASASAAASSAAGGKIPEELEPSFYELRWAEGSATMLTEPTGPSASAASSPLNSAAASRALPRGAAATAAAPGDVRWCAPVRLTQAQLLSLVNIFTDLGQQVPEEFGLRPAPVAVAPRTQLQRLTSAVRAAAAAAARAAGLLALLAVPLAAAAKAGGGDLGGMMAAQRRLGGVGAGASMATMAPTAAAAAAPGAFSTAAQRATPSAAAEPAARVAAASSAPTMAAADVAELAALCRRLESQLQGRIWLDVTGTSAAHVVTSPPPSGGSGGRAATTAAAAAAVNATSAAKAPVPAAPSPEFQLVVDFRRGGGGGSGERVLGCRPVNAAGMALLPELPLAAALRGRGAAAAVEAHLGGLSRERIERGKATPGRLRVQYRTARYEPLPGREAAPGGSTLPSASAPTAVAAATAEAPPALGEDSPAAPGALSDRPAAAPTASVTSAPAAPLHGGGDGGGVPAPSWWRAGGGGGASVAVLKVELHASADPARHAVQGKAKRQAEFALADVIVRPWYDSDSLLMWIGDGGSGGVQLPGLAAEVTEGRLLAAEEAQRAAFLAAYDSLAGGNANAVSYSGVSGGLGGGGEGAGASAAEAAEAPEGKAAEGADGGVGGARVLRPEQLSEQQLQEALDQLLRAFGLPPGSAAVAGAPPPDGRVDAAAPAAAVAASSLPGVAVSSGGGEGSSAGAGGAPKSPS